MKVTVGNDEFCPKCMEWREYDEDGKCKVCGRRIKKMAVQIRKTTAEYDLNDFVAEHDDEIESSEPE